MADSRSDPFCIIMRYRLIDFQDVCRPPSWIFKIKFLNSLALQRHVMRHCAKFSRDRSECYKNIAVFVSTV